jgi:hypothetical protein
MRLTDAAGSRDTNRDRRCAPPRSGSGPLRRVLSCVLSCMLWCTASSAMSRAVGIGPGLATGWGGRDGCWALSLGAVAQGAEPAPATAEDRDTRERRVLAFVAEHQPDLADVLAHLAKKPDEHAEAIADLDRSVRALSATRAKDERLFGIELRAWQARTRVDLLVAGWLAGGRKDRARLEPALRAAVTAELDAKAEHLAYRKERSAAWYDRQIVRLYDKRDELVAARLNTLLSPEEKKAKPASGGTR